MDNWLDKIKEILELAEEAKHITYNKDNLERIISICENLILEQKIKERLDHE